MRTRRVRGSGESLSFPGQKRASRACQAPGAAAGTPPSGGEGRGSALGGGAVLGGRQWGAGRSWVSWLSGECLLLPDQWPEEALSVQGDPQVFLASSWEDTLPGKWRRMAPETRTLGFRHQEGGGDDLGACESLGSGSQCADIRRLPLRVASSRTASTWRRDARED